MTPSRDALAALVLLVVCGGGFVLALYALTAPADRDGLLTTLVPVLAGVVAGVPAFLAWLGGQRMTAQSRETSEAVARVEQQTNGALTARINAANDLLREQLLAELLPTQRGAELAAAAERALAVAEQSHTIAAGGPATLDAGPV